MLLSLSLRDFVLVDRLQIPFSSGLTVLTGETGAGKSILVDALSLAVGERADAGVVRQGAQRSEIEAEFDLAGLPELQAWLADNGLDDEGQCLLRRIIDLNGRSRCFINGRQATVQQLREAGEFLLDLHGQHAHQSLLKPVGQRQLLDGYAGTLGLAAETAQAFKDRQLARERLEAADSMRQQSAAEAERLRWQIDELEQLAFDPLQWDLLQAEHGRLAHAAQLGAGLAGLQDILSDGECAAERLLELAGSRLDEMLAWDAGLQVARDLVASMQAELGEVLHLLRQSAGRLDVNPAELEAMEQRIAAVMTVARKYRVTPADLTGLLADSRGRFAELDMLADRDLLANDCAAADQRWRSLAERLSAMRREAAQRLASEVTLAMQQLALVGGGFDIAFEPMPDGHGGGLEQVVFRVAPHASAEPRPLARVASGGELSRISLALQTAVSKVAAVPVLVFDEVDVGIGGGVAEIVGRMLRDLSRSRQVICITHLPQVAAQGQHHLQVSKSREQDEVISHLAALDAEGRVEEISRMLGGVTITDATRAHAREMLSAFDRI